MSGTSRPSVAENLAEQFRSAQPPAPAQVINITVAPGAVLHLSFGPEPTATKSLPASSKSPFEGA